MLRCVQAGHDAVHAVSTNGRARPTTRELTEVIPYLDYTQTLLGESPEATSAAFSTCELRLDGGCSRRVRPVYPLAPEFSFPEPQVRGTCTALRSPSAWGN
jgi:hypothetical protein